MGPGLGDVVDLSFDGHEEGFRWIRPIVCKELCLTDIAQLYRRWRRLVTGHRCRGRGRSEETCDHIEERDEEGSDGEEGDRRQARVGRNGSKYVSDDTQNHDYPPLLVLLL